MHPRTIIFDFDGTLANSLPAWFTLINRYANLYGSRKVLPQDYVRYHNEAPAKIGADMGVPFIQLPGVAIQLKKTFEREIPQLLLYPGLKKVLENLCPQNHLGILTSSSEQSVKNFLFNNDVANAFHFIDRENFIFGKNYAFKNIINDRGINPGSCWYVGDETCDISAARDAGIKCISVTWGMHSRQALEKFMPDALIDRPSELIKALEG